MSVKTIAKSGVKNVLKAGAVGAATFGAGYVLLPKVGVQTSDEKVQQKLLMISGAAATATLAVSVISDFAEYATSHKKDCEKLESALDGDSSESK